MQLTKFTDYGLRVLMYLAVQGPERQPTARIAQSFDVSAHHLAKVATALVQGGFVISGRGRQGGLELSRGADEISIGAAVRHLTGSRPVVLECFSASEGGCKIAPACGLRDPLAEAQDAFMNVLDQYTLKDVTRQKSQLHQLLSLTTVE